MSNYIVKETIKTDISDVDLTKSEIRIRVNGRPSTAQPFIDQAGFLNLRVDYPKVTGILQVDVIRKPIAGVGRGALEDYVVYYGHSKKALEYKMVKYGLPQCQADFSNLDEMPVRNVLKLGGDFLNLNLQTSDDYQILGYSDIIDERTLSADTGLFDEGHVVGYENGGVVIMAYGFDPNKRTPTLIHSMKTLPEIILINGVAQPLSQVKTYEKCYFLEGDFMYKKISICSSFDTADPIWLLPRSKYN